MSVRTEMAVVDIDAPMKNGFPQEKKSAKAYVEVARRAFASGKTRDLKFRKNQLKQLRKMYEETAEEMVEALGKDLRKPRQECYLTEIDLILNDLKNLLYNFNSYTKKIYPSKPLMNLLDGVEIHNDPYGVVLVIGAWNYPIQLTLCPIAGAIAAGNCVIIKPSELSPATAHYISKTIPKYLDKDCYQVYEGGIPETTELLKERFDYIFFTGSPMVGKIVHKAAAEFLTPTTLELGGKSPVYIDDSADIQLTTKRVLWGKFINLGQTCIAPDYILCTKQTQENFLKYTPKIIKEFYSDNPKKSKDLCRVINERNFSRLIRLIDRSKVAFGGDTDTKDKYISPTILRDVSPSDAVMQEEIFGPILPIVIVKDHREVIDYINANEKPLALYIFCKKTKIIKEILNSTSSGGVTINDTLMHITCESLPFGGVGNSGMGNYHGKRSFDVFTHKKSVLKRDFCSLTESLQYARYPPYSDFKTTMLSAVIRKRREFPTGFLGYLFVFLLGAGIAVLIIMLI